MLANRTIRRRALSIVMSWASSRALCHSSVEKPIQAIVGIIPPSARAILKVTRYVAFSHWKNKEIDCKDGSCLRTTLSDTLNSVPKILFISRATFILFISVLTIIACSWIFTYNLLLFDRCRNVSTYPQSICIFHLVFLFLFQLIRISENEEIYLDKLFQPRAKPNLLRVSSSITASRCT